MHPTQWPPLNGIKAKKETKLIKIQRGKILGLGTRKRRVMKLEIRGGWGKGKKILWLTAQNTWEVTCAGTMRVEETWHRAKGKRLKTGTDWLHDEKLDSLREDRAETRIWGSCLREGNYLGKETWIGRSCMGKKSPHQALKRKTCTSSISTNIWNSLVNHTPFNTVGSAENLLLSTTLLVQKKTVKKIQNFHLVMNISISILYDGYIFFKHGRSYSE